MNRKKILNEVILMRTILAIMIVFMHSFTCFRGGWPPPKGYIDIPIYAWLARLSFAFTLEAFVFISGYLFAMKMAKERIAGKLLFWNKLRRLILPSILFSILYFFFFYDYKDLGDFLYSIINGCGHMWFLPMLFWCFLGCFLFSKTGAGDYSTLIFFGLLNIFSIIPLPLQLSRAFSFLIYFWGGYILFKHRERLTQMTLTQHFGSLWLMYIILLVPIFMLYESIGTSSLDNAYQTILQKAAKNFFHLLYASVGVVLFYLTSIKLTITKKISKSTIDFAACCFGIYLLQQFILKFLYYYTEWPIIIGPYYLPWLSFTITIVTSYLFTRLLIQSKIGRFLIG